MADPTAFYEPEEDELLSSLAVPAYNGAQGYGEGEDEYRRLQELEQHAYEQHGTVEGQGEMGMEMVPEDVKRVSWRSILVGRVLGFEESD
jgi:translation initiation factor 3 subunit L